MHTGSQLAEHKNAHALVYVRAHTLTRAYTRTHKHARTRSHTQQLKHELRPRLLRGVIEYTTFTTHTDTHTHTHTHTQRRTHTHTFTLAKEIVIIEQQHTTRQDAGMTSWEWFARVM